MPSRISFPSFLSSHRASVGCESISLSREDQSPDLATCMTAASDLKTLVATLRTRISEGTLDAAAVQGATGELASIGYAYDDSLFPPLPKDLEDPGTDLQAPNSLAEALLWKMGKWKVYKSFASHYSDSSSLPTTTDVVFYAFAKHLKNRSLPIYDQHALRALWAIDAKLSDGQASTCRHLLTKKDGYWKPIASGSKSPKGYELYVSRIAKLCEEGIAHEDFDKLLMPLGQALKDFTKNVGEFVSLAGCAGYQPAPPEA